MPLHLSPVDAHFFRKLTPAQNTDQVAGSAVTAHSNRLHPPHSVAQSFISSGANSPLSLPGHSGERNLGDRLPISGKRKFPLGQSLSIISIVLRGVETFVPIDGLNRRTRIFSIGSLSSSSRILISTSSSTSPGLNASFCRCRRSPHLPLLYQRIPTDLR